MFIYYLIWITYMTPKPGKYTIETFARNQNLTKQSALNLLSRLKKQGFASVKGGAHQKRIYTISKLPRKPTNGFYDIVNKVSRNKLHPAFEHYVHGKYTAENALIDGLKIGDLRTLEATMYLFRHVKNPKRLFELAKKNNVKDQLIELYNKARKTVKVKKIPKKYLK